VVPTVYSLIAREHVHEPVEEEPMLPGRAPAE
jgi:hypothetical protein